MGQKEEGGEEVKKNDKMLSGIFVFLFYFKKR